MTFEEWFKGYWKRDFEPEKDTPISKNQKAAFIAGQKSTGWQLIETAPKDIIIVGYYPAGDEVLDCPYFQMTGWDEDSWFGDTDLDYQPTHWMPIPEPPSDSEGQGNT